MALTRPFNVELRGFEPLTSSMPWKRATNCAIAPQAPNLDRSERRTRYYRLAEWPENRCACSLSGTIRPLPASQPSITCLIGSITLEGR